MKFQVVSVEGSVIISCATSINLNLIQIPNQLDTKIPNGAGLIYSSADAPCKHKQLQNPYQEAHMQPQKPKPESYSGLCSDRTCQSTRCYKSPVRPKYRYDKNCQSGSSSEKKIQNNQPKSQERMSSSLDVTSKMLSPRGSLKKSQVLVQEKIPKC